MLSHESKTIPKHVAVESSHAFGDSLFNIPLIKAIHDHFGCKITVGTKEQYRDGYYNIPWIEEVITIGGMGYGVLWFKRNGYKNVFQITQNAKFPHYKTIDQEHSLIDTPTWVGRELGFPEFDPKPIFIPTQQEIDNTESLLTPEPTIAIESEARSGQSWAESDDINQIIDKYKDTHRILWLSNTQAPECSKIDGLKRFSRREVIMCLRAADMFFSVGSGFFCSALALEKQYQPKKIICLWRDQMYKYKGRLAELQWHKDITWIDDKWQLNQYLKEV